MADIIWEYDSTSNPKQREFELSTALYTLYGGARGGGKTTALVNSILIDLLEHPHSRAFLGRKVFLDFRMTTYQSLIRWIPWKAVRRHNEQVKEIEFLNGSMLLYGGFDDRRDVERLKGAEFSLIAVDQVEELEEDEFDMLCTTLRFKFPDGTRPKYRGLFTANPAQNWVKDRFIHSVDPNYKFIPSTMNDNKSNLPPDYETRMRSLYKNRPEMLRAYIDGDWEAQAQENSIIKIEWINDAVSGTNTRPYLGHLKRVCSCDPARFGDDLSQFYALRNYEVIGSETWGHTDTMLTAGKLVILKEKHQTNQIGVDIIGLGAGVGDRLKEMGQPVFFINGSEASSRPDRYINLRAEMYFTAAEKFADGLVKIPNDRALITELNSVQYKIVNSQGKVKVEEKDEIKKRLGRSPDKADALVMAIWLVDKAPVYIREEMMKKEGRIKADFQTEQMLAAGGKNGGW